MITMWPLSLLIGLFFIGSIRSKLVVDSLDDLFPDGGFPDLQRIASEGELIKEEVKPVDFCPGVEKVVGTYMFYVNEDGREQKYEETVDSVIDIPIVYKWPSPTSNNESVDLFWQRRAILNCIPADNPNAVSIIRDKLLVPPAEEPYAFSKESPDLEGQFGQPIYLDTVIFKGNVKNGFFIEAGAFDFEDDSNTLFFEMKRDWSGLLVEPNPLMYYAGSKKNRKAWSIQTCLAIEEKAHNTFFKINPLAGISALKKKAVQNTIPIQCIPLHTLILATGNRTINYLSLDIEGAEYKVLKTIPWHEVDIEVISVEMLNGRKKHAEAVVKIRELMDSLGYVLTHTIDIDDFFVRRDLYEDKYKPDLEAYDRFRVAFPGLCPHGETIKFRV